MLSRVLPVPLMLPAPVAPLVGAVPLMLPVDPAAPVEPDVPDVPDIPEPVVPVPLVPPAPPAAVPPLIVPEPAAPAPAAPAAPVLFMLPDVPAPPAPAAPEASVAPFAAPAPLMAPLVSAAPLLLWPHATTAAAALAMISALETRIGNSREMVKNEGVNPQRGNHRTQICAEPAKSPDRARILVFTSYPGRIYGADTACGRLEERVQTTRCIRTASGLNPGRASSKRCGSI